MEPAKKLELASFLETASGSWLSELSPWGKDVLVRALIACAEWALPTPLGDDLKVIEDAVHAAALWCDDPSEASRVGARIAHEELLALAASLEEKGVVDEDFRFELDVTACAVQCASDSRDEMVDYLFGEFLPRIDALEDADHAKDVVRQLLLAWAQGKSDPRE